MRERRLKAIDLPCCCTVPHRLAAFGTTGLTMWLWALWSIALYKVYERLGEILDEHDLRVDRGAVVSIRKFALVAGCVAGTQLVLSFATFGFCIWPRREWLKNLSRAKWVFWVITWVVSIHGLVVYIAEDSWLEENCATAKLSTNCGQWWRNLQISVVAAVVFTLFFIFYAGVVLSSFVHTLHPDIFYFDSEAEDSDEEHWQSDDEKALDPFIEDHYSPFGHYDSDESDGAHYGDPRIERSERRYQVPYDDEREHDHWLTSDAEDFSQTDSDESDTEPHYSERHSLVSADQELRARSWSRSRGDPDERRSRSTVRRPRPQALAVMPDEVEIDPEEITPPPHYTSPDRAGGSGNGYDGTRGRMSSLAIVPE